MGNTVSKLRNASQIMGGTPFSLQLPLSSALQQPPAPLDTQLIGGRGNTNPNANFYTSPTTGNPIVVSGQQYIREHPWASHESLVNAGYGNIGQFDPQAMTVTSPTKYISQQDLDAQADAYSSWFQFEQPSKPIDYGILDQSQNRIRLQQGVNSIVNDPYVGAARYNWLAKDLNPRTEKLFNPGAFNLGPFYSPEGKPLWTV